MTRYSVIEADIRNNRNDIFPLLINNLQEPSSEKYVWNYTRCPYGPAHCWLARDEQSRAFIGTAALFPRVIQVNGELVSAGIAGDFAVDIRHRNLMAALALQKEIQEKIHTTGFTFIYGLPNRQSKGILLRIGYQKVGRFTHFIKPLKSEYQSDKFITSFLQFRVFARTVDILLRGLAKEKRYKKTLTYSIATPDYFDERFDRFWKNIAKHFQIIGERTPAFLNWRYIQSPVKKYQIFCLTDERKEIIAYIVYYIENNMCHIMDMLSELSDEVLSPLLAEFSRFIRMKGVGSISVDYLGSSFVEKKLREFNFLPIKNEMDLVIYSPGSADIAGLLNKENWHFFAGDNDV
jgi:hypothetical protein